MLNLLFRKATGMDDVDMPIWTTCSDVRLVRIGKRNQEKGEGGRLEDGDQWKVQLMIEKDCNDRKNRIVQQFELLDSEKIVQVLHAPVGLKPSGG